jgi:hypothetical protein
MKLYLQYALVISSFLFSQHALSQEPEEVHELEKTQEQEKKFTIGLGTYALNVSFDNAPAGTPDDKAYGAGISVSYAFTDNFSIRGEYYSLEHDQFSFLDISGIDVVAYFGTNLASQGFKAYIGGGFFSETWEGGIIELDASGLQLNGGIGYNWSSVALDLVVGIRDPSDYEDIVGLDAIAASGSLILSARF